jgi:hypothetical protein
LSADNIEKERERHYLYVPALTWIQTQFLLSDGIESMADCILEKFPWPDLSIRIVL